MQVASRSITQTHVYVIQDTETSAILAMQSITVSMETMDVIVMLTASILDLENTTAHVRLVTQEMEPSVLQLTLVKETMVIAHLTQLSVTSYNLERVTAAVFLDFKTIQVGLVV